jgi:Fe(3+) dicitrate transport protein
MKLKDYNLLLLLMLSAFSMLAQQQISGTITNQNGEALNDVGVYDTVKGLITKSDANGNFNFETEKATLDLTFFNYEYQVLEQTVTSTEAKN